MHIINKSEVELAASVGSLPIREGYPTRVSSKYAIFHDAFKSYRFDNSGDVPLEVNRGTRYRYILVSQIVCIIVVIYFLHTSDIAAFQNGGLNAKSNDPFEGQHLIVSGLDVSTIIFLL